MASHTRTVQVASRDTMIPDSSGVPVWLAIGYANMRKGFSSLDLKVREVLKRNPLSGHLSCFRGWPDNL